MKRIILCLFLSLPPLLSLYAGGAEESFVEGIFKYEIDGVHGTGDSVKVSVVQDSLNTGFHLPDSVLHIPASVVHGGRQYGIRAIKEGCILGCSFIRKLIIEEGIRIIEEHAFALCPNLQSIDFPSTINSIGYGLFIYSERLREIKVAEKNPKFDSRDNCNAIIETKENRLLAGCRATVIPSSVEEIDYRSFDGCIGLKNVCIPEGVKEIDDCAYYRCPDLESVHISSTVEEICGYAFCQCPNFRQITVDGKNPKYDSRNNCNAVIETEDSTLVVGCGQTVIPKGSVRKIGKGAFSKCISLKRIVIPEGVEEIADDAFKDCRYLESVSLPLSLKRIGRRAFAHCTLLDFIRIPRNVNDLESGKRGFWMSPFWGCTSLHSIVVDRRNKVYDSRKGCNAIIRTSNDRLIVGSVNAVIPNGVRVIGDYAFYDIPVKHIAIPKSVDSISTKAFLFIERPSCVTSIQVDKGNPVYDSRDNCNAIIKTASNTLSLGCGRTQIPGSVQAIGDNAFTGTDIGATLILPEGVEEIGDEAFSSCRFLNYIVLPRSIKRIAFSAFPSKKLQPIFKQDATKVEILKIFSSTSPSLIPLLEAQEKREKENNR